MHERGEEIYLLNVGFAQEDQEGISKSSSN